DARHIPAAEIASRAESLKKFKEKPVILYCDTGFASAGAARQLRAAGFNKVVTLSGGLTGWPQENLPLGTGPPKKDGKHSRAPLARSSCVPPRGAATASARATCSSARVSYFAKSRSTKCPASAK